MTAPSPQEFHREMTATIQELARLSGKISNAFRDLHDAAYSLPVRGGEKVATGSHSTPTESILLQMADHRRVLERAPRRISGSVPYWRSVLRELELALAKIEESHVDDGSNWTKAEMMDAERRAWERKKAGLGA